MIPLPFKRQKPPKMKMTNPLILMISIQKKNLMRNLRRNLRRKRRKSQNRLIKLFLGTPRKTRVRKRKMMRIKARKTRMKKTKVRKIRVMKKGKRARRKRYRKVGYMAMSKVYLVTLQNRVLTFCSLPRINFVLLKRKLMKICMNALSKHHPRMGVRTAQRKLRILCCCLRMSRVIGNRIRKCHLKHGLIRFV